MLEVPTPTDEDIAWVCQVMNLPPNAFHGDGSDERASILKSNQTLDIEACPGSGKTTLLVAKLAILARYWKDSGRGICVLSHTNVARAEIEERLKTTTEGQSLLRYPHFIGTIHGFINEFLALPYMRSQSIPVNVIDSEIAKGWRWNKLAKKTRYGLQKQNLTKEILEYKNSDCEPDTILWGGRPLGRQTPTFMAISDVCAHSCIEGIHCHEELFVWAEELIERSVDIRADLRHRFPMLFLDEVQDTTERQSKILYKVFMEGDEPVVRQRFGDTNQAIFQSGRAAAATDAFPIESVRQDIQKSLRFHQRIADLADPFGVVPQGLIGAADFTDGFNAQTCRNTVFLFEGNAILRVLPAFSELLIQELSADEIREGRFAAIGGVHNRKDDEDKYCVGHYWPGYCPDSASQETSSRNFVRQLQHGKAISRENGSSNASVQAFGLAILRAVGLTDSSRKNRSTRSSHRHVLKLLDPFESDLLDYVELVQELCLLEDMLAEESWREVYRSRILKAIEVVCGSKSLSKEAEDFLEWPTTPEASIHAPPSKSKNNTFSFQNNGPKIKIGSIHSVKGETHTSTLILDTFYRAYHFKKLKPWLLGRRSGSSTGIGADADRLKLHYVAMTRPSKILCIATRKDGVSDEDIVQLKTRGWSVAYISKKDTVWL